MPPARPSTTPHSPVAGNDLELDLKSIYSTKQAGAYPLVLATYEIVCSKGYDAATSAAVRSMLTVAANNGQSGLSAAGYVPLPDKFKQRVLAGDQRNPVIGRDRTYGRERS